MCNRPLESGDSETPNSAHEPGRAAPQCATIPITNLELHATGWMLDAEIAQRSANTLAFRRMVLDHFLWFCRERDLRAFGTNEIRLFLAYVTNGDPKGRWGKRHLTGKARPRTVQAYYVELRSFCKYLIAEGIIARSPMERIPLPQNRPDQIVPFTPQQVQALLTAARKSRYPKRDEAILLMLFDTGVRATELCDLNVADVDIQNRRCVVRGKGDKSRAVFFSATTTKAILRYMVHRPHEEDDPLFLNERGDALTRSGLLQLMERLGKVAGITGVRCSPHSARHTMAVTFLRAGGATFTLRELLGHTRLEMTQKYVALAQADLQAQHRQFSPVEHLKKGKTRK